MNQTTTVWRRKRRCLRNVLRTPVGEISFKNGAKRWKKLTKASVNIESEATKAASTCTERSQHTSEVNSQSAIKPWKEIAEVLNIVQCQTPVPLLFMTNVKYMPLSIHLSTMEAVLTEFYRLQTNMLLICSTISDTNRTITDWRGKCLKVLEIRGREAIESVDHIYTLALLYFDLWAARQCTFSNPTSLSTIMYVSRIYEGSVFLIHWDHSWEYYSKSCTTYFAFEATVVLLLKRSKRNIYNEVRAEGTFEKIAFCLSTGS